MNSWKKKYFVINWPLKFLKLMLFTQTRELLLGEMIYAMSWKRLLKVA